MHCSLFRALLLAFLLLLVRPAMGAEPLVEFSSRERIALIGNSLAERMNLYGHFETLLHTRFPDKELVVRNFAWPCDEVGLRQRPNDYTKIDDPLKVFEPNTFICFFGFNESFAGRDGLDKFKTDYEKLMADYATQYGQDGKARFILVSPIPFENTGNPLLPEPKAVNDALKLYTAAVAEVARKNSLPFVDLFSPFETVFSKSGRARYTIHGCHLTEAGDKLIATMLDNALFGSKNPARLGSPKFDQLRAAINDKSWVHLNDYRMLNGWYVYGGRRTWDTETFPREYKKVRNMAAVRDQFVWEIAKGKLVSAEPDDSETGELFIPKTRFGVPQQAYSEPKQLRYLSPEESIKAMTVADGYEVNLFASEREFPELSKPVQMAFDSKGRLWVSCMPTYPQWKPGDPKPKDRLLIFEDKDRDGRADKVKVFYDQLHCPTGFEFWNGGVLVTSQPRILFLKDTDGDDQADDVTYWTDGWATDDTHHTVGAYEWSNGGLLHMLEGVSMSTAVETPWGPMRNRNTPGAYVIDPATMKIRHFVTPGYGNPWCYVFNWWGQGIVGDGTTAQQHWDTPLSGAQKGSRKGMNTVFNNEGMRPCIGSEFIYSRHFPNEVQGQFLYACVINMNGIPRFEVHDDGAGYNGKRIADLVKSSDRNFRPIDPLIGPDGALWFGDWHNPLIGHMQYSQRDPNRDKTHGRVYRLTAKDRPLLKPLAQAGQSIPEVLDQLKEYEPRTRYAARRELRQRPREKVLAAVKTWVGKLDTKDKNYDLHRCEALWVQQGHHAVDPGLLGEVLRAKTPEARAAATHLIADQWSYLPEPMSLLRPMTRDEHPRVRLEALRALSFVETPEAVDLALEVPGQPTDYWLDYTLQHTFGALEPVWRERFEKGEIAKDNRKGREYLEGFLAGRPSLGLVRQQIRDLVRYRELKPRDRQKAMKAVVSARGKADNGKPVFERMCVACHKIGSNGAEFGPDLTKVATRLKREELIESLVDPNAKLDPKFVATNITTKDGEELSGLVATEDDQSVTMILGAGVKQVVKKSNIQTRQTLNVSSMPDGLAEGLSAEEFLDLIEYLSAQK